MNVVRDDVTVYETSRNDRRHREILGDTESSIHSLGHYRLPMCWTLFRARDAEMKRFKNPPLMQVDSFLPGHETSALSFFMVSTHTPPPPSSSPHPHCSRTTCTSLGRALC